MSNDKNNEFDLSAYDFPFSDDLIAQTPATPRDSARLLVLDRRTGAIQHRVFRDLPDYLRAEDCIVLNRTKVLPARLIGRKTTGGKADLLLLREIEPGVWAALSADLKPGARVEFEPGIGASIEKLNSQGEWTCRFPGVDVRELMARRGLPPIPPYILKQRRRSVPASPPGAARDAERRPEDFERYQTVYARDEGSVAAPTAGFHFTPELLQTLRERGVRIAEVTLHVGHGTFQPITAADVREHRMKSESYSVPRETAETIARCRASGGRIVTVGTTSTRTMETWARAAQAQGATDLYIRPGHEFKSVDALATNFHQPRSTPLVLTAAFAGRDRLIEAYRQAVAMKYRLYSFGDAMLIL